MGTSARQINRSTCPEPTQLDLGSTGVLQVRAQNLYEYLLLYKVLSLSLLLIVLRTGHWSTEKGEIKIIHLKIQKMPFGSTRTNPIQENNNSVIVTLLLWGRFGQNMIIAQINTT